MTYVVGIDGGQSSTTVAIADERGRVCARVVGEPTDLVGESRTSSRRARILESLVERASIEGGVADVEFAAAVAGISGYGEHEAGAARPQIRARRLRIVHDTEIALAGAFPAGDGIVVIAGTGSVAYGGDETGRRALVGGWGYLFGDAGSAFWIARLAIARAMEDHDAGRYTELAARAIAFFDVPSLRAIQHGVAHGEISRATIAAFATDVAALAAAGSDDASSVTRAAAAELARAAVAVDDRLGPQPARRVAPIGGVFRDARLRSHFEQAVAALRPGLSVVDPLGDPVSGAIALARSDAGLGG